MRVRLVFEVLNPGAVAPYFHQDIIDNLVSDILKSNPTFKDFICYNFSGLKGQIETSKKGLAYLSSKATIVLSSNNPEFIDFFAKEFLSRKYYSIGEIMLSPLTVDQEIISMDTSMEIKYVCISPMVILDPRVSENGLELMDPFDDSFSDILYESTLSRMEEAGYNLDIISDIHKFQILPDKDFMNKFTAIDKKYSRIHPVALNGEKFEIRTYSFPFTLYAAPEIHSFIFDCGLGIMTQHGLGMLDISGKKKINTKPYN